MSQLWQPKIDRVDLALIALHLSSMAAKMGHWQYTFKEVIKIRLEAAMKQLAGVIREPKKFPGK